MHVYDSQYVSLTRGGSMGWSERLNIRIYIYVHTSVAPSREGSSWFPWMQKTGRPTE